MPRLVSLGAVLLAALLGVGGCGPSDASGSPGAAAPSSPASAIASPVASPANAGDWQDATLAVETRVDALLAQMTVDEKIGQMTQIQNGSATPADVTTLMLGSVLSGGDGAPVPNDPASWYATVDAYQQAALATRLGIPILYGVDAIHGVNGVVGATIRSSADAVVAAWLPGTEGAGVVDALLGDSAFTATTPYTWPLTPADAPRTGKGRCEGAQYPVSYGLDAMGARLDEEACPKR